MRIRKKNLKINFIKIIIVQVIFLLTVSCNKHNVSKVINSSPLDTIVTVKAPKSFDSTVVFSRIGTGKVIIDQKYCKTLDEPTRAILFYYANKFNTGFNIANKPLLAAALEFNERPIDDKKLIKKWFTGADYLILEKASVSAVLPDGASNYTWFILISIIKENNIRRVYFRTLDTENEDKYREAIDVFQISGDHIEVIKVHDFGDLKKE